MEYFRQITSSKICFSGTYEASPRYIGISILESFGR